MMNDTIAAAVFASLGNPARLAVLRFLVRAGNDGLNVGELQRLMDMPASTLAHHLSHLAKAGTILQEKQGREVRNVANYAALGEVANHLTADCCAGVKLD